MNEVERAVLPWVQVLPSHLAGTDPCLVDALEELHLFDEVEGLARHHIRGSEQLEHERVKAGIGAHIEDALALDAGEVGLEILPAKIIAPGTADDEVAA